MINAVIIAIGGIKLNKLTIGEASVMTSIITIIIEMIGNDTSTRIIIEPNIFF